MKKSRISPLSLDVRKRIEYLFQTRRSLPLKSIAEMVPLKYSTLYAELQKTTCGNRLAYNAEEAQKMVKIRAARPGIRTGAYDNVRAEIEAIKMQIDILSDCLNKLIGDLHGKK